MVRRSLFAAALLLTVDSASASVDVTSTSGCALQGKISFSTSVWAASTGGVQLASLYYAERRVELTELPTDSTYGRARVEIRREVVPSIRVVGWAPADGLQLTIRNDAVVVPDHVWVRRGAAVHLTQPKPGEFSVEPRYATFGKVRANVSCGDLALGFEPAPASPTTPATTHRFKGKSTALFDAPNGKQVFTLDLLGSPSSFDVEIRETKGAWLHFQFASGEKIDGWLRAKDLVQPKEEESDAYGALGGLGLSGIGAKSTPVAMVATKDTAVYLDTAKSATVAGTLEKGAKVRAWPAAPGFTMITTWDNDIAPPPGKSFFVLTDDLKISP